MSRFSQGVAVAAGMRKGRWLVLGLLACSLLLLVSLTSSSSSDAAKVTRTTVILGQTAEEPDPSCPNLPCQAIGSVTGFQVRNNQTSLPFRVPRDGKVKSWTLTLAQIGRAHV